MRYFKTEVQRRNAMIPFYKTIEFDLASDSTTHINYTFFKKHIRAKTIDIANGDTENFESKRLLNGSDEWKEKSETQFLKDVGQRQRK